MQKKEKEKSKKLVKKKKKSPSFIFEQNSIYKIYFNSSAKSIEELAQIFKELAVLVIDQGTVLDRIDYNMEMAVERTKQGMVELEKVRIGIGVGVGVHLFLYNYLPPPLFLNFVCFIIILF